MDFAHSMCSDRPGRCRRKSSRHPRRKNKSRTHPLIRASGYRQMHCPNHLWVCRLSPGSSTTGLLRASSLVCKEAPPDPPPPWATRPQVPWNSNTTDRNALRLVSADMKRVLSQWDQASTTESSVAVAFILRTPQRCQSLPSHQRATPHEGQPATTPIDTPAGDEFRVFGPDHSACA